MRPLDTSVRSHLDWLLKNIEETIGRRPTRIHNHSRALTRNS